MSPFLSFVRASFVQQAIFVSLFWTTLYNIVHLGEKEFLTAKDFVLTPKRLFFCLKQFLGVAEQIPEVFSSLTIGLQNFKYISMHSPFLFLKAMYEWPLWTVFSNAQTQWLTICSYVPAPNKIDESLWRHFCTLSMYSCNSN